MRRVLVLLAAAATLLVLAAEPAAADPGNQNTLSFTLNCGSAGTVDAVFELSSSDSFHIVQFSSNFLWKSLDYVTPDGQTGRIERGINGGGHSGLVTARTSAPSAATTTPSPGSSPPSTRIGALNFAGRLNDAPQPSPIRLPE